MDFHSLTRRELQSLCKLNKIPANITNAMADALQSLQTVEGIEEFLNLPQSEKDDLVEVSSPKVPQSRCRTFTRQKVKIGEAENLRPTAIRTTRRESKQLAGDVKESKNNMVKIPAMPTTRRKALATSSCGNVNNRLNECEEEAKKASSVQKAYSTRRSTRLTEKKSAEPKVKKDSVKAVKMNSFVDEMDVASKEVCELDEVPENTMESGNPNAEVEDICNAFEKLDVLIEESAQSLVLEKAVDIEATYKTGEEKVDNQKLESDETPNPSEDGDLERKLKIEEKYDLGEKVSSEEAENDEVFDQNTELDGISSPLSEEKLDLGEKFDVSEVSSKEEVSVSAIKDHEVVMATEEDFDSLLDNNGNLESESDDVGANIENMSGPQDLEQEHMFSALSDVKDQVMESNGCSSPVSDMILSNTENAFELDNFSTAAADDEITKYVIDVISTIDKTSTMSAEVEDLKTNLFTEFHEFPVKKTHNKTPT